MIRTIQERDYQAVTHIYNHYIRNTVISFEEREIDSGEVAARVNKVKSAGLWWLVCEAESHILGYAYASTWNERSAYRNTVEISIYLDPETRGRGYGTELYRELFRLLKNKKIHTAIAGIALPNPASVKLHEKFGMEKTSHFREVGYKFDQLIDVGYWQVILDS